MSNCSNCGSNVDVKVPDGDNKPRYVCSSCGTVLYENPKLVVGCVTEYEGKILLCKRAIEPRLGYWTVPAGFMELSETLQEAAARETLEEACAKITLGSMLTVVDVVQAGQVHVFFRGTLDNGEYATGDESLDARLYAPDEIPWDEIAFPSGIIALKQFLTQRKTGIEHVHTESATPINH
ncbi:MAG: NUDIX hydrolase [Gammaproteobacteria bacterium]|nr:NUDIX hydrolase [Gammaproteobacteria bacterium]MCP4088957.1 NUDIX hydrolase [Gammaproteobacteria bacterium]MCP4831959.1 NUDIX hydrolase [Gammaproteobacteria bacterium]MCP4927569.1 NUDIX hydrolase [Gammaproteobacteria bacterium]